MPYTSDITTNRYSTRAVSITIQRFTILGERVVCHVVRDGAATELIMYVVWSSTHCGTHTHVAIVPAPLPSTREKGVAIKASVENLS